MLITLYIPRRGGFTAWGAGLADTLKQRGHDVRVAWTRPAARWPVVLARLLTLEALFYGEPRLARPLARLERREIAAIGNVGGEPDLILNLGARPLLNHAAPVFELTCDGALGDAALIGAVLAGRAPVMSVRRQDDKHILARSYPSLDDREVLLRALDILHARKIALFVRAVERHADGGEAEVWTEPPPAQPPVALTAASVIRFAAHAFTAKLARRIRDPRSQRGVWRLAARRTPRSQAIPPLILDDVAFTPLAQGADTYADPFLHEREGRSVLFAERKPAAGVGVGVIVCAQETADGGWGPSEPCLERPYHLSYPFVFDHAGETWMMPETGAARTLELYRALDYPRRWTLDRVLMQDVDLADATLVEWKGRWWLFAARSDFGGSIRDELVAYHADSPLGPWSAHAMNPLKSDVRSARPAGRFIVENARLLRPAQDCEAEYGTALVWCEITELTPITFAERVIGRWDGASMGAAGLHTFARGGGWDVIDLKRTQTLGDGRFLQRPPSPRIKTSPEPKP